MRWQEQCGEVTESLLAWLGQRRKDLASAGCISRPQRRSCLPWMPTIHLASCCAHPTCPGPGFLCTCTGHVGSGACTSLRRRTSGNLPSQHQLLPQQNHPWTTGTGPGMHSKFKICRYLNLFPFIFLSLLFLFNARILSLSYIPFGNLLCSLGWLEFTVILPQLSSVGITELCHHLKH